MKKIFLGLCAAFWLGFMTGCYTSPPAAPKAAATEISARRECEQFYQEWQVEKEKIRHSSRTGDYIGLSGYRKLVGLGKPALPFLEEKLAAAQGMDFMLAYAVIEINGWNRSDFINDGGEQGTARRVLAKMRAEGK